MFMSYIWNIYGWKYLFASMTSTLLQNRWVKSLHTPSFFHYKNAKFQVKLLVAALKSVLMGTLECLSNISGQIFHSRCLQSLRISSRGTFIVYFGFSGTKCLQLFFFHVNLKQISIYKIIFNLLCINFIEKIVWQAAKVIFCYFLDHCPSGSSLL